MHFRDVTLIGLCFGSRALAELGILHFHQDKTLATARLLLILCFVAVSLLLLLIGEVLSFLLF